jgi:hypothetical protein
MRICHSKTRRGLWASKIRIYGPSPGRCRLGAGCRVWDGNSLSGRRGRGQSAGPLPMNDDLLPDLLLAVDQQLAARETPYVASTLRRLRALGLDETEAKTQIALCLGQEMDAVVRSRRAFDEKSYRAALAELPFPEEDDEVANCDDEDADTNDQETTENDGGDK